jgi:hypothetical protein
MDLLVLFARVRVVCASAVFMQLTIMKAANRKYFMMKNCLNDEKWYVFWRALVFNKTIP